MLEHLLDTRITPKSLARERIKKLPSWEERERACYNLIQFDALCKKLLKLKLSWLSLSMRRLYSPIRVKDTTFNLILTYAHSFRIKEWFLLAKNLLFLLKSVALISLKGWGKRENIRSSLHPTIRMPIMNPKLVFYRPFVEAVRARACVLCDDAEEMKEKTHKLWWTLSQ